MDAEHRAEKNEYSSPGSRLARQISGLVLTSIVLFGVANAVPVQAHPDLTPSAAVTLSVPSQIKIGQNFSFTATFANNSSETGYGPIVDLVLPTNGADGAGNTSLPLDGITFLSATYLGAPVTAVAQVFPGTDITPTVLTEPFTYDSTGAGKKVYGTPGDTLVSLQLPFGSFTPDQPAAPITINAHLSNFADASTPLTILARGGYEYGATALNDWCCGDPSILSPDTDDGSGWPSASTSPTVMTASKSNNAPEGETATGPNFPRRYSLSATISAGQTITDFNFVDTLPNRVQYQGGLTSSPAYITATEPITTAPLDPPESAITVSIDSVTNTASAGFNFFVPRADADGNPIVDPSTGACTTTQNPLDVSGIWTPLDPRDGPTVVTATLSPGNSLSNCAITVQKGVTDLTNPGSPRPLDTVQYTLNFQVSDYFAFQGIHLQDFLPDGIHFDSTFTPTLSLASHGGTSSGDMDSANFPIADHWTGAPDVVTPTDGTTEINFNVSNELVTRGASAQVLGGCVPDGGTGGPAPDCSYDGGPTTGTIVFRGVIQTSYTDIYPDSRNVYLGDTLNNTVTLSGAVLDDADLTPTGSTATNGSHASVTIVSPTLTKSVYAIDGNICDPCANPHVGPGQLVTYRIKYQLPSASYRDQSFTDYLPLPIFDATTVVGPFDTTITSTVPAAGQAHFGPAETLFAVTGITPTLSASGSGNSITFDYGSYEDTQARSLTTDILFSVVVNNAPFADGLYLTNQVESIEDNHTQEVANSIVQVQLGEPLLTSTKGVVASTNPNTIYSPATVGPVTFNAPGTVGPRWTGVINSTTLAASPIESGITGVDANDTLTFALVIANQGTSAEGAFEIVISDTIPTGFITPTTGLNLRVSYGDGSGPIDYVKADGSSPASPEDLFNGGIKLVDPSSSQGVCQAHSLTNGLNIIVLTYDLQIASDITPNLPMTNTGELAGYSGNSGGPNFLSAPEPMTSTVTTALPVLSKTIAATGLPNTPETNVAVGELITYSATITVPEGVTHGVVLTDTLTDGLAFVTSTVGSALSSGLALSGSSTPTITPDGRTAEFNLGDLTNSNDNAPISATLTLTYPVVVLNTAANTRGVTATNGITMTFDGGSATAAAPALTLVEPTLKIDKTANPTSGDAGDPITYTLALTHTSASDADAYDVVVTDTFPAGMTFSSWDTASGVAPDSVVDSDGIITATWSAITLTQASQIDLVGTLDTSTQPNQTLTNTASLEWSSLPGDVTTPQSSFVVSSTERTGDASNPGGALNDYAASASASITTTTPSLSKSIAGTNLDSTSDPDVAIGESITYSLSITVPEGTMNHVVVTDTLDQGLAFAQCNAITASPAVTTSLDFATACSAPAVGAVPNGDSDPANQGRLVVFDLGSLMNADTDNSTAETITIDYSAVVVNSSRNADGTTLANGATLTYDGGSATAAAPDVTIVEPLLTLSKTASPTTGDAADPITYTLTVTNAGASQTTAFDVVLTDTVPAGMTYVSSASDSGLAPNSLTYSGGVITATWNTFPLTQTSQLHFVATLDPATQPSQTISNTAYVAWTSLPGDVTTAQSPYNLLSAERTGDTSNPGGAANDYLTSQSAAVQTDTPSLRKTISATSLANTSGLNVAIGETVTYSLAITIPEGVTDDAVVTDTLPSGLALLTNTVSATVPSALSISGSTTPTVSGSGGVAVFDLGTITNSDTDNSVPEVIQIDYPVVVLNSAGNTRGVTRANSVQMTYAGGSAGPVSAPSVKIVEPTLSISKAANPTTGDAGDVITYTVTVTHTASSNSDAFDAVFTDTLPAGTTYAGLLTNTSGVTPDVLTEADGVITATWSTLSLGQGSQIEFTASLDGSVAPNQTLTNQGYVVWSSLPGDVTAAQSAYNSASTERTGNPSNPGGALNNYAANGSATATVNNVSTTKSLVTTSESSTTGSHVAVGEIVRYRLATRLPEGTSTNLTLTDLLPNGLEFTNDGTADVAFVANGAGISSSTITAALPGCTSLNVAGSAADLGSLPSSQVTCPVPSSAISPSSFVSGTDPIFSLGNVVNSDSDSDGEYVVVEFNAIVLNVSGNYSGVSLANSFRVAVNGSTLATSSSTSVTVAEPAIGIAKAVSSSPTDAGDTVVYTLVYSNTASSANRATAFDVALADTLDGNLSLVGVSSIAPAGTVVTDTSTPGAGGTVAVLVDQLPPAVDLAGVKAVTVTVTATVASGALNGQTIPNVAHVTFTSLPGETGTFGNPTDSTPGASGTTTGERTGSGGLNTYASSSNPVDVTLATPTINKLAPSPTQYTIGDAVTYNLCVSLPEGVTSNLVVTDTLPNYMAYVPGSGQLLTDAASAQLCNAANEAYSGTLTGPGIASAGQNLVLTFSADPDTTADNDPDDNTFVLQLQAVVENVSQNQDGQTRTNNANLTYTNPSTGGSAGASSTPRDISLIEPVLSLYKSIAGAPSPADAGGWVTYTAVLSHSASSHSNAYDVVYSDTLPSGLTSASIVNVDASGMGSPAGQAAGSSIRVPDSGSFDLPLGAVVTVTYQAQLDSSIEPNEIVTNTGNVTWSSEPGANPNERTSGDSLLGAGGLNDYELQSSASFTTTGPTISKSIDSTSLADVPPPDVTIGEIITYSLAVTLPEGTTPSLVVTDTLPAGLTYVASSAVTDTAGLNGSLSTMATSTNSSQVVFTFADPISVAPDNDPTNNAFHILFQGRVANVVGNQNGTSLPNGAALQAGSASSNSNTATATVVVPELSMAKSVTPSTAAPNDPVTVTLVVTNTGTSPAYDVAVADALSNSQFTDIAEGGTPSGFAFSTTPAGANTDVGYAGGTIDAGDSATFTFGATLTSGLTRGTVITDTAAVTGTTLPGIDANERSVTATNSASLTVVAPDISISKTDGRTTIVPGATTVYTLTVTNGGTRDATGVVVTDTLPSNTTLVDATGSYVDSSGTLTWTPFSLAQGASVTQLVTVTLDDPQPAGAHTITNTAGAVDDGTHGADTTPDDNTATDVDTVNAAVDLALSKSDGGATPTAGSTLVYTLAYTNTGDVGASGVKITDTIPANTRYTGGSAWACAPNTNAGGLCTFTIGSLPADSLERSTTFTVTVNSPLPAGATQIANSARIGDDGANGADAIPDDNSSSVTTPLAGVSPDFAIAKSDGGAAPTPGSVITYTLHFTNTGNIDASNVTITETVPANTQYTGSGWTCPGGTGGGSQCTRIISSLAGGGGSGSAVFAVTLANPLPANATQITNTASIDTDSTPGDNSATIVTDVTAAPVLNIVKSDGGATATPGGTLIYTLTYSNTGNIAATNVIVTDTVPANTNFDSVMSVAGWTCTPDDAAGSICTYAVGTLPGGSGASQLTFAVDIASTLPAGGGQLANTATISDDAGHNSSSLITTAISGAQPDLVVTKTPNPTSATAGSRITYTVAVTNTGDIGAQNVLITETVPANTTFAGPASTWTCAIGSAAGTACLRNIGVLASGGTGGTTFAVQALASLPVTTTAIANTIRVNDDGTNGADANPADNVYTDTLSVSGLAPALAISKHASLSTAHAGSVITYTLNFTNTGNTFASGVLITETVPANTTFIGSGWSCQPDESAGSSCGYTVGALAGAGGSGSAQFVVTVDSPLPSGVTQIANSVSIADDSAHSASATVDTPAQRPTSYLFLPYVVLVPYVPPTPTPTPSPTPVTPFVDPKGMVSDPARDHLYLVSKGDNSVAVFKESTITSTTPTLLAKISVGQQPFGIGMVDDKVYVANSGGSGPGSVSVISATTMAKIKDISLQSCGNGAAHLGVNPNTHRVYTALHSNGKVAVIDSSTDSLSACVTTNSGAFGLAVDPASNSVFVGNRDGLDLWRIDGATNVAFQVANLRSGSSGSPYYVGFNPTTRSLFAMVGLPNSNVPNKLYVYSVDSAGNLGDPKIASVGNTDDGGFVIQSQCSSLIYVAETADNDVRILNPDLSLNSLVTQASGKVDQGPFGLLENPTLKRVYVSNKPANTLKVLGECTASAPARGTSTPTATAARSATPTPGQTTTPTGEPSATPTAAATTPSTDTPQPTTAAAATSTPAPSETTTPEAAPSSTPTVTASPAPTDTAEPAPTKTPEPSATPTAAAPAPTATDTLTPEATPTK